MSDEELVEAAVNLAGKFYEMHGYMHRPGFKYWESPHPQERLMWDMACLAFEQCRGSDVKSALGEIEDDS